MAQISTVFLFGLRINTDSGNIELFCTKNFFILARSHLCGNRGRHFSIGAFTFTYIEDSHYDGVPRERSEAALKEARNLCYTLLSIYRSAITFERVFADAGSYETWMAFNHRPPTSRQLAELARYNGVRVPFLSFPYKSPLLQDDKLDAKLGASLVLVDKPPMHPSRPVPPKIVKPVNKLLHKPFIGPVTADKVAALANHFRGS